MTNIPQMIALYNGMAAARRRRLRQSSCIAVSSRPRRAQRWRWSRIIGAVSFSGSLIAFASCRA